MTRRIRITEPRLTHADQRGFWRGLAWGTLLQLGVMLAGVALTDLAWIQRIPQHASMPACEKASMPSVMAPPAPEFMEPLVFCEDCLAL